MKIEQGDVASLLAKSTALSAPVEGSNQNSGNLTPEEAVALVDAHENVELTSTGETVVPSKEAEEEVVVKEGDVETKQEETLDLTGMTLDEQIEALKAEKLKQEQADNPLKQVEDKIEDKGLDISEMAQEYINNGELSEDTVKSLHEAGFDDLAIEAYIETKTTLATQKADKAIEAVCGTKENFSEMTAWMQDNLSDAEFDAYNEGVQGKHFKVYLENMYTRYSNSKPAEQRLIRKSGVAVTHTNDSLGFSSQSEMITAMNHPRYKSDVAYRREVQRKVALMN